MSNPYYLLNIDQGIATVTLNRPDIHNAFDDLLIQQLTTVFDNLNNDSNVRVVILAANGKSFCAGADLNWMHKMVNYSYEENLQDALALAHLLQTLNKLNKPTIALIQGAAYGGGVGLVACCDIAIASTDATFCFSEVKIGLVPATISPYVIAAIGERACRRYFLTAEKFDAHEAYRIGLVHAAVMSDDLINTGKYLAKTLLLNSPAAVVTSKQLINKIVHHSIDAELIHATAKCIADVRISPEGQEGLKAFFEKRKPKWGDF